MKLFNLFRRPARPAPARRARLSLESLDHRICPDGDPWRIGGGVVYIYDGSADNPPTISNVTVDYGTGGVVTISGTVLDENPAGLTVNFAGPQQPIDGQTRTTAATGAFSLTVTLQTNGTDNGTVTITTQDAAGHASNTVYQYITPV